MKSRTFQTRVWLDWPELKMCRKAARMAIKRWCSSVTESIHLKMRQKEPQERGNIVKYCSSEYQQGWARVHINRDGQGFISTGVGRGSIFNSNSSIFQNVQSIVQER